MQKVWLFHSYFEAQLDIENKNSKILEMVVHLLIFLSMLTHRNLFVVLISSLCAATILLCLLLFSFAFCIGLWLWIHPLQHPPNSASANALLWARTLVFEKLFQPIWICCASSKPHYTKQTIKLARKKKETQQTSAHENIEIIKRKSTNETKQREYQQPYKKINFCNEYSCAHRPIEPKKEKLCAVQCLWV